MFKGEVSEEEKRGREIERVGTYMIKGGEERRGKKGEKKMKKRKHERRKIYEVES